MTIDTQTTLTVVSMAARGRRSQAIADATTLPVAVVSRIVGDHGGPDMGRLAKAAEDLRAQLGAEGVAADAPTVQPAKPAPDRLATLTAEAARIGSAKLTRRAQWIGEKLDELADDLLVAGKVYDADATRRAEADKLRAELAELRTRQAEVRAKLAPGVDPWAQHPAGSNAAVRAWAKGAGVPCPAFGKIPKAVRSAWEAAHPAVTA